MQPKPQTELNPTSWNEFCALVVEIVAELSPCPEPTLFVIAATRGLQRFGDGTLDDLGKLLRQSLQELQARGLVEINKDNLLITFTEHEDILELTTVVESPVDEDILVPTSELELYRSPDPDTRDETQMNQMQTQTQISNSLEHAPEPTREQIIAAMRRFVS